MKVGMCSLATSVKAQGVGSAYEEMIHLLAEYGKGEIEILRRGLAGSDIIHFHTLEPFSLLYMKLTRKPTIASVHFVPETMKGSLRLPRPFQLLLDRYMLFFYRSADYLHIVHPDTADILEKYGINKDRIFCIPNVVSEKGFMHMGEAERAKIRKRFGYRGSDFIVMGSGQIQSRKGVEDFVQVARQMPDTKFVWAGGFSFGTLSAGYPELKALLSHPPDNLIFTGIMPRADVCELLNAADLFFLPSFHEQFSMSILEAAAVGKPILLRDLPSYRIVYANRYLCGSTVSDFVSIIRKLQDNRDLLRKMGRLSEEISAVYTGQKIYELWKAAYIKCMNGESGKGSTWKPRKAK